MRSSLLYSTARSRAKEAMTLDLTRLKPLPATLAALDRAGASVAITETIPALRPALLAALHHISARTIFVITATTDVAERSFADLLYYLGDNESPTVALLRARDETLGALESPSERSARMTLYSDLLARRPRIVLAPIGALRQFAMPPEAFTAATRQLHVGEETGWDVTLEHLHASGYHRVDVVSAAGEYAVRGGILDLYPATTDAPVRIEFFGDTIEAMRSFAIESQRSDHDLQEVEIAPWSELPRGSQAFERTLERAAPRDAIRVAMHEYLERGHDLPSAWLPFAYDERRLITEYLDDDALIVLDEPVMISAIARALDEERARERDVLIAALSGDEFAVRDDDVSEALLAEIDAPVATLAALATTLKKRRLLIFPGGIENDADSWHPVAQQSFVCEARPAEHFNRQITLFTQTLRDWIVARERTIIVTTSVARSHELLHAANIEVTRVDDDHLAISEISTRGEVIVVHGSIEAGFVLPDLRTRVLGDREIFGQPAKRVKLRAIKEGVPVTLADLRVGDFVVHAVHGIGQYLGLRSETILGATQDYLDLKYAGTDRMLIPVTQMHQVGKYSASEGQSPRLSKMGGADWVRTKSRVSESLAKIADGLVELYAAREIAPGYAFAADTPWQAEVEEAFPYEPTTDQRKAIDDTKRDMERERPMDRLICGDVGYGKTEVAVRAAFKAIADKKQVAVLAPTTLLADQHYRTFSSRFAAFPVRIERLTRFQSKAEQKAIVSAVALGKVDLVVGTHRLLQKDIAFADLGLIVVDEEQRFGVMHKERLKQYRAAVDVLTLSATPIPRTLHMSLLGVRDLSLIQTAPKNRMSIKTLVVPASDSVVQRAIANELDRGGQIYYLHNRVESIHAVANALRELVPRARIGVGHGQMPEGELEPIMKHFIEGELDILVATTIIENGIDIPNVNTMIVSDADKFGLAQLYQLRGRVGRSNHQAYCYLLYQGHKALSEDAKARLAAIREFAHLGSGLQIAMRDLEIRGAGNLLGAAQSGFVGAVGFDTYCQMLAEAIATRRGEAAALEERREAVIDVKIDAFIPNEYIPQVSQKIAIYQQLARARTLSEVEDTAASVRDRFGPFARPLENLVALMRLRVIALAKHVTRVIVDEERLTLGVGSSFTLDAAGIPKLQSLTKNRFRFSEGKIIVDLPKRQPGERSETIWVPLLTKLLEAL